MTGVNFLIIVIYQLNFFFGTEYQRRALVDVCGLDVQNTLIAC